jgi:diguanylate cyclase (GGDEF)-like protein
MIRHALHACRTVMRMVTGLSLLCVTGAFAADPSDRQLDAELAQWVRIGYNEPKEALKALQTLRASRHEAARPAHALRIDYTIGWVQALAGDMNEAHRIADELDHRPGGLPMALLLRADVQDRIGQPVKAGELAQQALTELLPGCPEEPPVQISPACDWRGTYAALRLVARAQSARGEPASAQTRLHHALALAQAAGDTFATVSVMGQLATNAQDMDQPAVAQQWLTQALQLAQGDVLAMVRMRIVESGMAAHRNDTRTQLAVLEEGLQLAKHTNARREVATLKASLADAYMHTHQPARAAQLARQALPVVQEFGDQRLERTLRHNLSVSLVLLRQFDAARREVNRVIELARGDNDAVRRILQLRELGEAYAAVNQPREALRLYHEERSLSAETAQRKRESALRQLSYKYDSEARQRDLELARRQQALQSQELTNRRLAQYVGVGLALLLGLSVVLMGVMLARVRDTNKRLKAKQSLLRAQSERDPLTNLANRRYLLSVMEREAGQAFHGGLLMIDIDHFKQVNDRHGHAAGDAVIREIGHRIGQAVRAEDVVVRWGGEEFLVYARTVALEALQHLAERILMGVAEQPVSTANGPLRVTASIGYAHFPLAPTQLPQRWEQAVNWADMALYTAKSQGRNRAHGIATVQAADVQALMRMEADFEAACRAGQVRLQTLLGPEASAG